MLERKTIDIFAYDIQKPTISVTYIRKPKDDEFGFTSASFPVIWIREDKVNDFMVLNCAFNYLSNLSYVKGAPRFVCSENQLFTTYQKLFARNQWRNYETISRYYETEALARIIKPHRGFIKVTKQDIEQLLLQLTQKLPGKEPKGENNHGKQE